jgi:2-phosphosulfolactate phosphatase
MLRVEIGPVELSVAFTPNEVVSAPVAIAIDVIRATSTIAAALAAGFESVRCVAEIDEARALAGQARLAGERGCVRVDGFDFGNSPVELAAASGGGPLALTTTNGTRLLVAAAARCDRVYAGTLTNVSAVTAAVRRAAPERVALLCAGADGAFALDDAYVAGRYVQALGGDPDDSAVAAAALAASFASPLAALERSRSAESLRRVGLEADVRWCAQVDRLRVVPLVVSRDGAAATLAAESGA